jgi:bacteriocin-like protein
MTEFNTEMEGELSDHELALVSGGGMANTLEHVVNAVVAFGNALADGCAAAVQLIAAGVQKH